MPTNFKCKIELDHAEFEGDEMIFPLRRCLLQVCQKLESGVQGGWYPLEGKIMGENGFAVGQWSIEEEEDPGQFCKEEKEGNGLLKAAEDAQELLETIQADGFNPGESPFEENPKTNPWSEIEALEAAINKAKKRQE